MSQPAVKHVRNVVLGLFDRLERSHMSWIIFRSQSYVSFWMTILVTVKDLLTSRYIVRCFICKLSYLTVRIAEFLLLMDELQFQFRPELVISMLRMLMLLVSFIFC
jgi:hypothetical protein